MVREEFVLDGDVIAPRELRQRYRIYRMKKGEQLDLMATCESDQAVGVTLCQLGDEGEFLDAFVGVLDGMDHQDERGEWIGKWLILPWMTKGNAHEVRSVW